MIEWVKTDMPITVSTPLRRPGQPMAPDERKSAERSDDPITRLMGDHMTIPTKTDVWTMAAPDGFEPEVIDRLGAILFRAPIVGGYQLSFFFRVSGGGPSGLQRHIDADDDTAQEIASREILEFLGHVRNDMDQLMDAIG